MKKIKVYFGRTNAYNAEVIENVTDGKVIVLDTTKTLEEIKENYKDLSLVNNFYDISSELYEQDVLNEFELTEIAEYEEE